jgi:hypothetical protein
MVIFSHCCNERTKRTFVTASIKSSAYVVDDQPSQSQTVYTNSDEEEEDQEEDEEQNGDPVDNDSEEEFDLDVGNDDNEPDNDDYSGLKKDGFEYKPPSLQEIRNVLAIMMVMSMNTTPSMREHWNTKDTNSGIFHNVFINTVMSGRRFMDIYRLLNIDLEFLNNQLRKNSKLYYYPSQVISIDETIYPFKGKFKYRQKIPTKPNSTGLKYFLMADKAGNSEYFCETTGYILNFFFYQGKDTKEVKFFSDKKKNVNATERMVEYFLEHSDLKKDYYHHIYGDKYYRSLKVRYI